MVRTCAARVNPINTSAITLLKKHGITLTALIPLGAAVRGLDLREKPKEEVLEALQTEMAVRGFLVFKDQGKLSGDEQVKASEYWGGRRIHSTHGVHPEAPNEHIFRLSNNRQVGILGVGPQWHNDGSFERGVFAHVGYHIIRAAEKGGGTIFSHQGAAFDALPEEEQERWQRLVSVNSNSGVLHPMVHTHPISGRKSVYLHLGMTGAVIEVITKEDDKSTVERLRLLEEDEMRHLFQSYNALLNAGFATGQADLLGAAPRYGQAVRVTGLNGRPELNGRSGKVVGVLDRATGRVAIELSTVEPETVAMKLAVKPDNLLVTTVVTAADEEPAPKAAAAEAAAADVTPPPLAPAAEAGVTVPSVASEAASAEEVAAAADGEGAYTAVYEYEEGDCVFIDNLAVAHRATPEAHRTHTEVGLRILHRTTIKAMIDFDPPYNLPAQLNVMGPNPLGQGVWRGGGLGFRWDETIPMQN